MQGPGFDPHYQGMKEGRRELGRKGKRERGKEGKRQAGRLATLELGRQLDGYKHLLLSHGAPNLDAQHPHRSLRMAVHGPAAPTLWQNGDFGA